MRSRHRASIRAALWASWLLFLAGLALPAFRATQVGRDPEYVLGIFALALGPMALLDGHYAWLANPLLLISWLCTTKQMREAAQFLAALAFIIAGTFLLGGTLSDGGSGELRYRVSIGYFAWLASILCAALAGLIPEERPETPPATISALMGPISERPPPSGKPQ